MAGNVAIRFSVENAETVRQALQNLGKDGEKAMRQLDAASQQPGRGMQAVSAVIDGLRNHVVGLAFNIGPLGTALVALGPVGLAVAAAVGGVVKVFSAWADTTREFVDNAKQVKEAAETAGLGIMQFKGLRDLGAQVGLDAVQTSNYLDRMSVSIEEARRGGGALYDQLMRIDAGLARDVVSTVNLADAIDVLSRARERLTQAQKNELDRAVGGRGAIGAGQLLDLVREKGGMAALEQGTAAASKETENLIRNAAKLKVEIEAINQKTAEMWGGAGSQRYLQYQKEVAEDWQKITKAILGAGDALKKWWNAQPQPQGPGRTPSAWRARQEEIDRQRREGVGRWETTTAIGSWDTKTTVPPTAAFQLELMQRWTALLGEAITPAEQLRQKVLELAAAQEKGGVADDVRNRSLNAFILAQERAAVAARTQLGVATEEEMMALRLKELHEQRAKGFIKNEEEMAAALRLATKEVKENAEALRVRNSLTPQLTRLSIESDKLRLNLDEGLASALRGSTSEMLEMVKGTKTLGQGLTDLSTRILEAVANAMLMKAVVGPLANAMSGGLSSFFGGGGGGFDPVTASAFGNAFSGGQVVPFARGGIVTHPTLFPMAKGWGLMGEAGPEAVMPLHRTSGGRLGVYAAGAGGAGGAQPQFLTQIINNHSTAKVSSREENDGRGGRKMVHTIDETVAGVAAQPNSRIGDALGRRNQLVRR